MERISAFDKSILPIRIIVVMTLMVETVAQHSTSSGGVHKKGPQASITCCSLWTRALTTHGILPLLVLQDPHGLLNAHSVFLKRSAPTCNGDECCSPFVWIGSQSCGQAITVYLLSVDIEINLLTTRELNSSDMAQCNDGTCSSISQLLLLKSETNSQKRSRRST